MIKGDIKLLEVKNLCYLYSEGNNKRIILEDINYQFVQGKFYTVLGESGSGKTTFVSLLTALDSPSGGEILYKGQDIQEIGLVAYRRNHVGIVFQDYNLIHYMTGKQNLEVANLSKQSLKNSQEIIELLSSVGISESTSKRKVSSLSGGEKQRIAIARALMGDKNIIIADEPTGNLDKNNTKIIIDILSELAHTQNKCVIVVTHSHDIASQSDIQLHLNEVTHQFEEIIS